MGATGTPVVTVGTLMGPLTGVGPKMTVQIVFEAEGLAAQEASMAGAGARNGVHLQVEGG